MIDDSKDNHGKLHYCNQAHFVVLVLPEANKFNNGDMNDHINKFYTWLIVFGKMNPAK